MKHKDDNKVWALWLLLEFVSYIISSNSLSMIGVWGGGGGVKFQHTFIYVYGK
jgi:hypothetical protein